MEFASLISQLSQRPVPPLAGRHVYLWQGEPGDLLGMIPLGFGVQLDLYDLAATLPRTPFALDEARRLLENSIVTWLRDHAAAGQCYIVVVTGAALLQRYRVSLEPFFQISNESRMVVFVAPRREAEYRPPPHFPSYVELQPGAILEYLRTQLGERAVIGEMPS
jgi:hypothetical protein